MLQQQETLYVRYTNLGSHKQGQIIKSNHSKTHTQIDALAPISSMEWIGYEKLCR